jgi:hypothetical protein
VKAEKVLEARVARADRDLDLALLAAEGARGLPALALGPAGDLTELTETEPRPG